MSGGIAREGERWLAPSGTRWEMVCGLEVHAQLATRTKLFCGCSYEFGAPPNSRVCPVCTGQPGALPVLNAEALHLAIRAALALGCKVSQRTVFDRKNYFYCDLPKNYQISQLDLPYCRGGFVELASGKRIRLERIHLEEDAGKAIHDRGDATLVDLNRAGVPLIESVTMADLSTPEEAVEYLQALKEVLQYVGASRADMEKGELRCDVNVSVRPEGEPPRTKVEIKNLNSFRHVKEALEHEVLRQVEAYESGDSARWPRQETRLWDAGAARTRVMRSKEEAEDYRYFPDPDLPPFRITASEVAEARRSLPELPAARRRRYVAELGLTPYDAGVLTASRDVADFFEATARLSGRPKESANWVSNELLRLLGDESLAPSSIDELALRPHDLAELIGLVAEGRANAPAAKKLLRAMVETGRAARELLAGLGLEQVRDEGAIEKWCREAIAANEKAAAEYRGGKRKALGALVGQVMQASGGQADPKLAGEILARLLAEE